MINGVRTDLGYSQGRRATASTGGSTSNYNYDPFGRLDTITSSASASSPGQTLQSDTYDGFDHPASVKQYDPTANSWSTTNYTYDSLDRMTSQTTAAGPSTYSYPGLSSELAP